MGRIVRKLTFGTTRLLVRILCAMALLSVGFAHRPAVSAAELTPLELAQYRLPDGTLPVLCVTERTPDGKEHSKAYMPGCEACRISAAILLPTPPTDICEHLAFVREDVVVPRSETFRRQLYPPNSGPRAPPALRTLA
ncbi:hypothetical protein [Rhizobium sp. P44RR-XXIV]|uniref:hypothetical protein n=1 Tax=Rhizobium sp. P44RR-XXIV TaxID=1921145 RepID=UPI0009851209|nr:hypothetical protein [Rhizobium sp. P44RR-XXIV]TIX91401.1 hypothetical protein BSK43_010610 [Rhizobium sp. P44RR-XXIV]